MIRNRGGDFIYSDKEQQLMLAQLKTLKSLPIAGIVYGALLTDGNLDLTRIAQIAEAAYPLPLTIHKCIDLLNLEMIKDVLPQLKSISNVQFLLSSGLSATAQEGLEILLLIHQLAAPEISLIAAGGISYQNIKSLHERLNLQYYHGKQIVGDFY